MSSNRKPRNKKHRPIKQGEQLLRTQPWKLQRTFGPLIAILDELERDGTVNVVGADQAVYKDIATGQWVDMVAAIEGTIETFEIHEIRTGEELGLEAMRQLVNKLRYGMLIFESDTQACRVTLARMRAIASNWTISYASALVDIFLTREQLTKVAA